LQFSGRAASEAATADAEVGGRSLATVADHAAVGTVTALQLDRGLRSPRQSNMDVIGGG
jgi:hypothetical protein